jgi:hypothetical protein
MAAPLPDSLGGSRAGITAPSSSSPRATKPAAVATDTAWLGSHTLRKPPASANGTAVLDKAG